MKYMTREISTDSDAIFELRFSFFKDILSRLYYVVFERKDVKK